MISIFWNHFVSIKPQKYLVILVSAYEQQYKKIIADQRMSDEKAYPNDTWTKKPMEVEVVK